MRKSKIGEDRYIVPFKNKYYVVNEYTSIIFELLENAKNIKDFENKYIERFGSADGDLKTIVKELDEKIDSCEYYETNVSLPTPLKIQWKMTMKCNLVCKHCYLGELTNECFKKEDLMGIAKKINEFGVMEVTLTGGEVFTVECIDDIIEYFHDNEIRMIIFTNATLVEKHLERLEKIKNKSLIKFIVSVDGTEEAHDYIRGKGMYKRTMANIRKLADIGYKVSVNMVLNKSNYSTLYDLVSDLNKAGVVNIQLSELIPTGRATKSMCMDSEDIKNLQEIFKKIHKQYNLTNIYYSAEDDDAEKSIYLLTDDKLQNLGQEHWKCGAGIGKATVLANGDMVLCPFLEKYKLGNVRNEEMRDLWEKETRYNFLKMIAQNNNGHRKCIVLRQYSDN